MDGRCWGRLPMGISRGVRVWLGLEGLPRPKSHHTDY